MPLFVLLAQAAKRDITPLMLWLGVLIVLMVVMGVAIMFMRRRLLSGDSSAPGAEGQLETLRELKDSGKITKEEFDRVKRKMAERMAGRSLGNQSPDSGPGSSHGRGAKALRPDKPDNPQEDGR